MISRRSFIERALLAATGGLVSTDLLRGLDPSGYVGLRPAQVLLDMVHNNPGETPFVTHYNDPAFLKRLGYRSKVYELFEGAQFAIDWESVDPDIFPAGSPARAWVDQKAVELDKLYTATKQAGLSVYCHTDMIVFPKTLVQKYRLKNFTQVSDSQTQEFVAAAIRQMFARFPQLDGLVVRIGETYLQGAPYHMGGIADRNSPDKTIIPLLQLLRREVCEKLNRKILFRSWLSFDRSVADYQTVSDGVDPHPNLSIAVKHCEDDFHRGNPFSRTLGVGRHAQVVEVQCQREYEGKAAYPNYIAHGVIEGFEEHHGKSIRGIWNNPLIVGMFTWSRGGGWKGPYITNELWCDLNAYVLCRWAQEPSRSEESIFNEYCSATLKLSAADTAAFRKLCLLSADAVYRGIRGTRNEITPWWTRDQFMGRPPLPGNPADWPAFLQEKDEALQMWRQIVDLGDGIQFSDPATREYVRTSCRYGLDVYRIYNDGFHLAALGDHGDKGRIQGLIADYDQTWAEYRRLKEEHPSCGTLYTDKAFMDQPGLGAMVDELRKIAA
jgi:hypothetical protein